VSFDRPWVLLLTLLPMAWAALEWRRSDRRIALVLKALSFVLVLVALSEPAITVPETRSAVALLVDTSASLAPEDLERASQFSTAVENQRGRNRLRVIPFGRTVRQPDATESGKPFRFRPATSGEGGFGTDLEAAVREAVASFPGDAVPRIVLLTDGHENHGSIARGAWLSREMRVPIDTVPLAGRVQPSLRLEFASLPAVAFTGEKFPIDLLIDSPRKADATVELAAEGKAIGSSPVKLETGSNQIRVHASLNAAGAVEISGRVSSPDLGDLRFQQAVTLRRPKVLFVSNDPPGSESQLFETLRSGQFDIVQTTDAGAANLDDFQVVVLNNQDLEHLAPARKSALEDYVRRGGGLLVIGGERNVYQEKKVEDALDRVLPAKIAPPRSPEGTCVVLIVDKSSSMEGRKMELARLSAIGVVENLRAVDSIGILIFDNSFQWAVPIRKAEDRNTIKRLVAGIMPDGGTQIAPALSEAFRKIMPVSATYKHIVLLTDGISEEGDSMALAREAASQQVTISTVGLGQDVNRAYLEKVAVNAKGKSYFLVDPSGLEQILLKDVMEHTGSTAVEKPVTAEVAKKSELLDGTGIETAPPLSGYVRFEAKPGAGTLLTVDKKDPLYTAWQFGLGRAAVWSSDAKSRWAEKWIGWPGFDRFWLNVFRDLLPKAQSGEATTRYDEASGDLLVEYRLAPGTAAPARIPQIYVFGPDGFRNPVTVRKTAEGVYAGSVPIGNRQGLFRIRPLEESHIFPETGLYREEDELKDYGHNEALLRHVATFTGGRYDPPASRVFDTGGRSLAGLLRLWPLLLGFAVLLTLGELVMRKWPSIRPQLQRIAGHAAGD
jgi:Ca-activated chloride channel homolog